VYSFIVPRKKFTIDSFTYMWMIFILITSVILIAIGLYLDHENGKFDSYKSQLQQKIKENEKVIKTLKSDINFYKKVNTKYKEIHQANTSLKNGISNLLSFIPDQIVLNKMILKKYEIKLYGYVDSPKTYKLLLEPPLKSIFDSSKVGFTKLEDGKYLFSSYNKLKRVDDERK